MGSGPSGMDHSFRDPLVVEVHDLFTHVDIVDKSRAAVADAQTVIGVIDGDPLGCG